MERIYFDNNATTPLDPAVREAMLPYLNERFGNPSSGHHFGEEALAGITNAREQTATLLNCPAKRIFFTTKSQRTEFCPFAGDTANGQASHAPSTEAYPCLLVLTLVHKGVYSHGHFV